MNINNNCVIFSPERGNDNLGTTLFRIGVAQDMLTDIKASFKQVEGVYTYEDGTKSEETSFLVDYDFHRNSDMLETIKEFAFKQFGQVSVLHLDSNRNATLIYENGITKNLGRLVSCTEEEAKKSEAYTYTNGIYYVIESLKVQENEDDESSQFVE